MITFNAENLRCVYVYILKVTTDYVYVTTTRAGAPYRENSSPQANYRGYKVSKVSIHPSVANSYANLFKRREFSTPWLASLNYYGDEILSIEIQQKNLYTGQMQKPENWRSAFSKSAAYLKSYFQDQDISEIYVNGTEIFWPVKVTQIDILGNSDEFQFSRTKQISTSEVSISYDNSLTIREIQYVALETMGLAFHSKLQSRIANFLKSNGQQGSENSENLLERIENIESEIADNGGVVSIKSGRVLAYYPNGLDGFPVYSPVLRFNKETKSEAKTHLMRTLFGLTNTSYPMYVSAEYAMRSARVIGSNYGYEEADFLDIQSIIVETGEVNLHNISESSRLSYATGIAPLHMIAYLFRYIYRERDLRKLRDLNRLVRGLLSNGFIHSVDVASMYQEGFSGKVPLASH